MFIAFNKLLASVEFEVLLCKLHVESLNFNKRANRNKKLLAKWAICHIPITCRLSYKELSLLNNRSHYEITQTAVMEIPSCSVDYLPRSKMCLPFPSGAPNRSSYIADSSSKHLLNEEKNISAFLFFFVAVNTKENVFQAKSRFEWNISEAFFANLL